MPHSDHRGLPREADGGMAGKRRSEGGDAQELSPKRRMLETPLGFGSQVGCCSIYGFCLNYDQILIMPCHQFSRLVYAETRSLP
jgi:hypothetical protein